MKLYKDEECTEELTELNLEESYVQDVYGGVLENAMVVGTEIHKTIYFRNDSDSIVLINDILPSSPFVTAVVENPQLEAGHSTPIHITFSPKEDPLRELEEVEESEERIRRRNELLNCSLKISFTEYLST